MRPFLFLKNRAPAALPRVAAPCTVAVPQCLSSSSRHHQRQRKSPGPPPSRRHYSTSQQSSSQPPPSPPPRWLSDLTARLGKCIMFGCGPAQVARAAGVLRALATEWRALVAGSEGFLTGGRRGLEGQQVVWGEQDSFQHVNNANYIRYAESSRVNWITHFAGVDRAHGSEWRELMTPKGVGLIMKTIKAEYKFPMTYPDRISVYHKLRALPDASDTSLILDCVVLSHRHRRATATTEEDVVIYDYKEAKKTTMPPFVLDVFRDTWRLQEEEVRRARSRVWDLIREVEGLEKETWDREDAIEDLGPWSLAPTAAHVAASYVERTCARVTVIPVTTATGAQRDSAWSRCRPRPAPILQTVRVRPGNAQRMSRCLVDGAGEPAVDGLQHGGYDDDDG
ncbi:hypothetical protein DL771_006070 [Monosporascus sp. 5C6A]|nr:hypothetical protein DL771_006070 [Monosporascus sp. 5C6A]